MEIRIIWKNIPQLRKTQVLKLLIRLCLKLLKCLIEFKKIYHLNKQNN